MPTALVIRTAGTNCEQEMLRGFALAGAETCSVHLDSLMNDPSPLDHADLIGLPGGFSYGDDVASGRIMAMHIRRGLADRLGSAVDRGACILGVCNGFQVLVQAGLLPAFGSIAGDARAVGLGANVSGRFQARWVGVEYEARSRCIWTNGLAEGWAGEAGRLVRRLPIAHGEGRFVADPEVVHRLSANGQVVLRTAEDVNGSVDRIAGICDGTGRVFGLMPHPERFLDWDRHPAWTALEPSMLGRTTPGLQIFRNAVESVAGIGKD